MITYVYVSVFICYLVKKRKYSEDKWTQTIDVFIFCHSSLNRMLSHNRKMSSSQNFSFYEWTFPLFLDMLRVLWSLFGVASYLWGNLTRDSGRFRMIFLFWAVCQCKFMVVWCVNLFDKSVKPSERIFWRLKSKLLWQITQYLFLTFVLKIFLCFIYLKHIPYLSSS